METENTASNSLNLDHTIRSTDEYGLLYGVGNEVWVGLLGAFIFICLSKYIVDVFVCPVNTDNMQTGPDQTATRTNQG